uniref:Transposase (Putative), gypsy type n=1 Tax=Tanacetum cinerariifolium TaxID=118510 RepID=A0A6L2KDX6_TANCI|nr:hypothetical protein [Tanacetum cinerariifolium]
MSDPLCSGVNAKDVRRLCDNVIDLRTVHSAMLYEIGLTTIWKHVGYHPVFKDGEGNVAASMSEFLKFPMARDASRTVHSVTPLNTFNDANANAEAGGSNQVLQSYGHMEEEVVDASNNNDINNEEVNSPHSVSSPYSEHSLHLEHSLHSEEHKEIHTSDDGVHLNEEGDNVQHGVTGVEAYVSAFGGSGRHIFPGRNSGDDKEDHKALQQVHLDCAGKEIALSKKLAVVEKEKNDLLDKSKDQEERIQGLEEALTSKTSSLSEAEKTADQLKRDLERLTVDLSQAEVVRRNYVGKLLPTVVQGLLSSDEYKKSLSKPFNQAIAVEWLEGVKVDRIKEETQAILVNTNNYDPQCHATFMSAFDELFSKSYPYVEKLNASFRLPLGNLQNMWPEGEGPTVGGRAINE